MRVALVHPSILPVLDYGGTQRVVWWLAKALASLNHKVYLVCKQGKCDFAEVIPWDFKNNLDSLSEEIDIFHFFGTPVPAPQRPFLVTIDGNGQPNEKFFKNTIFVSKNHASRHQSTEFVYNGLDPEEYFFSKEKEDYLLFLGKARWKIKNLKGAISLAKKTHHPLRIIGGEKMFFNGMNKIYYEGFIGGEKKAKLLSKAKALLFPVLWDEPFGLAVVEALVSGTPVIASKRGSLPELISTEVGFTCNTEEDYLSAIQNINKINSENCRNHVLNSFTNINMAKNYLRYYEKVLNKEIFNEAPNFV